MRSSRLFQLSVVLIAWLAQGCVDSTTTTRIACGACEEPTQFVRLQTAPLLYGHHEQGGKFSHPFSLSAAEWKTILSALRVQTVTAPIPLLTLADTRQDAPAFTPDDLDHLSATLSRAFAKATPREWVVFGLIHKDSGEIARMTTGGWFVEGDRLHLLLANYRCAVTMPGTRDLLTNDPLLSNAGGTFVLLPGPHQTLVKDSGSLGSLLTAVPLELAIAYKPLLLGEPTPQSGAKPDSPQGQAPAQPAPSPARPSVEERLQALKRLKDQGVITDDEFRIKKNQLLDQF
ncbi:MAG: SHOCT domain-containing protein [Nitrospirae bacterium]|nr:MAG: SHOCT domain-containing protein [Nitrospirota bacterium]